MFLKTQQKDEYKNKKQFNINPSRNSPNYSIIPHQFIHETKLLFYNQAMSAFSAAGRHRAKRIFKEQKISRHLYCCICQDVFEDPVRAICGHTFCYLCIENWALVKSTCPICKRPLGARKLERDLVAYNIIQDLEVQCYHEGCDWSGIESHRKKHQRVCFFKPKNQVYGMSSGPVVEVKDHSEPEDLDQIEILSSPLKPNLDN